jgi:hypothetical protein
MRTLPIAFLLLAACTTSSSQAPKTEIAPASVRAAPTMHVFHLKYADANEMSGIVQELFPVPSWEENIYYPGVRVVSSLRTNSIVVCVDTEKAADMERIAALVASLDVEIKPAQ